ncbi:hypothetical protein C0W96_07540 [Photobacterium kishitanii]|uniref:hypothetical protein n=1 Tax=Photobacterium kishitanii TaxID=318456 RepID=UPI0005D4675C|nr:hypothetical protein [Photobacterium kishitanii]KJG09083.1 hypothetical protein UB40_14840 [Photobacterium kishitanii]PSU20435.1 hypothetical protein CTM84_12565 [Photobacterium kishitanii]PSV06677.1 hypothetical protein C0W96_07540 [Photobacterium kishitanii]PSV15599.1 hypothetical protein C0W59_10000 [Photobacterium kishitanii]PSV77576.1 hypothetical protein C0W29_03605 [Photobacterium kishitanii]
MNFFYRLLPKFLITVALLFSFGAMALTESGMVIKNQAGATYRDSAGIERSTTSNLVETIVQPVVAMTLTSDQSKLGAPDGKVIFTHVLTNTGNVTDTYKLDLTLPATVISSATIYPDMNPKDGIADVGDPIISGTTLIGPLAPNETYSFVIVADIYSTATVGDVDSLTIKATSQGDVVDGIPVSSTGVGNATNTDTVTVTDLPIIEITKAINADNGASPSGPYVVTFTYSNVGLTNMNVANTNGVILKDILPEGMKFNGAVNWSISGTELTPTTNTGGGNGTDGNSDLTFTTCIAPNTGCSVRDEVEFTMDGLASGESATISFEVMIANGLSADTLYNNGIYGFDADNSGQVDPGEKETTNTNIVPFRVNMNFGVIANNGGCDAGTDNNCDGNDDTNHETVNVPTAKQGERVAFTNYIWNIGNSADTFNITYDTSSFPTGTSFFLYKSDGITPLVDTDGTSDPDTGIIPATGETCRAYQVTDSSNNCGYKVVLIATLPPNFSGTGPFKVFKHATSSNDTSITNKVIDELGAIEASTVDLTNNFRAETATTTEDNCDDSSDNCGFGAGAEPTPVTTNIVVPGQTTRFTLYVTNTSAVADGYQLEYSSTDFNAGVLPAGWTVEFKNISNAKISDIAVVLPDATQVFYADVTVPITSPTVTQSIYFKVSSATTGVSDVKHDAVTTDNSGLCIGLVSDSSMTIPVGSSGVYKHTITNTSNDAINNIPLTITNNITGFSAILYEDTDSDLNLSTADVAITSIATLAAKESKLLFVKVFSAPNSAEGITNITTVTATVPCGTVTVQDSTTISNTNMSVTKEQALDAGCDGSADGPFSTNNISAAPDECVIYQLKAQNIGIKNAVNVKITDAAPTFTTFLVIPGTIPTITTGTINPITNGGQGAIVGTAGTVTPGNSETLIFGIRIDK